MGRLLQGAATRFRAQPPGVVEGPIGAGSLNLPIACARGRALASKPFKFTLTGPHMLAKMLHDRHYRDPESSRTRLPTFSPTR
jgi:5-methyltetrahydropteroyltriglutamate--homocysteine methyltransferase